MQLCNPMQISQCFTKKMYRSIPSERPPIFTLGWQERGGGGGGGGRINGSDPFSTGGAPPILISAPCP